MNDEYRFTEGRRAAEAAIPPPRRQAALQDVLARLTGKSAELFAYEDVRRQLQGLESSRRTLEDVPLAAIVGTVGRYNEFTRSFLPRKGVSKERWISVRLAMEGMTGVPPIEVYRISQVYFVLDGNHRVSVARRLNLSHIQAYVTEVRTRVSITPDLQPDELILKAEYADFLARTRLNELRPRADLSVTVPGKYPLLLEHVAVHRYFMGIEQSRKIPYEEAVTHWYDAVYSPAVRAIRERGILREFPRRTETDLYLYISQHRAELEQALGWEITVDAAVINLLTRFNAERPHPTARAYGAKARVLDAGDVELPAAQPERQAPHPGQCLFDDVLAAVNGEDSGWQALELALEVARRENARLHGLHVIAGEAETDAAPVQAVRAEFERRCAIGGVRGRLAIEPGGRVEKICERARWTDLIVTSLTHPPASDVRLSPGFRTLLRRSPTPVLAVPGPATPLHRVLLAYDASPKAEEALYVAAGLVDRWKISLVVLTVSETGEISSKIQWSAREYLESHEVQAVYVQEGGDPAAVILATAAAQASELLLLGGYGYNTTLELMLGSTVNQVLCQTRLPVLICR